MKCSTIIKRIKKRLKENKNYVGAIIGPVREGKSVTACKFCEKIDKTFKDNVKERCFFSVKSLIHFINTKPRKWFRGKAFVLDEGGVAIGHREALSTANKRFGDLLQSWGYLNAALFITSPSLSFIDKSARGTMLNGVFRVIGHNKKEGICYVKVYDVKGNPFTGDGVRPFPHKVIDGEQIDIEGLKVRLPSLSTVRTYNTLSWKAKREISQSAEKKMEEDDKQPAKKSYRDKLHDTVINLKGKMKPKEIKKVIGLPMSTVHLWIRETKNNNNNI